MKRFLSIVLSILIIAPILPFEASAAGELAITDFSRAAEGYAVGFTVSGTVTGVTGVSVSLYDANGVLLQSNTATEALLARLPGEAESVFDLSGCRIDGDWSYGGWQASSIQALPAKAVVTVEAEGGPFVMEETTLTGALNPVYRDTLPEHNDGSQNSNENFLGVTQINQQYFFGTEPCILQGAERALNELGSKTYKFYLSPNYDVYYAYNMNWPQERYGSPLELVRDPSMKALTDMDFNTFYIGTYIFNSSVIVDDDPDSPNFGKTLNKYATYWYHGISQEQKDEEYRSLYELTYYLCTEYAGTDKTFVLQNWEGDWSTMMRPNPETNPSSAVFQRMIEWANIRQDAVNDARNAAAARLAQQGTAPAHVYHALEVNLVGKAVAGGATVTNNVIPYTYCDYYTYSCYDTQDSEDGFRAALQHLKTKAAGNLYAAKNGTLGGSRVTIGEYGGPINSYGEKRVAAIMERVISVAREQEYDHVFHWQFYCDGRKVAGQPVVKDDDVMGYYMITPTGKKTIAWNTYYKLIHGEDDPEFVPEPVIDYAFVEVSLSETNDTKGLWQREATDGLTSYATQSFLHCRATAGTPESPYMYFDVDDDFFSESDSHAEISFTYFDAGTTAFVLEYWNQSGALTWRTFSRTGTNTWKTASVRLSDVRFVNGFHYLADFRFSDVGSPLYLNHVLVKKYVPGGQTGSVSIGNAPDYAVDEQGISLAPHGNSDPEYQYVTRGGSGAVHTVGATHLWFDIDDSVVSPEQDVLYVEIEYFDEASAGGFVVYYTNGQPSVVSASQAVMFTGSGEWKTATLTLTGAVIDDLWYGDRDFSIYSNDFPVYVRKVKVSTPKQERSEVSVLLKNALLEDGLFVKVLSYDGSIKQDFLGERECRSTDASSNQSGVPTGNYIYFDAADDYILPTDREVYIAVTYFDAGAVPFQLQYNSTLPDDPPAYLGLATPLDAARYGTNSWKTRVFRIENAEFQNKLQGGLADFRLADNGSKLSLYKVAVSKSPIEQELWDVVGAVAPVSSARNASSLSLPAVPEGYSIRIESVEGGEDVLTADGVITASEADTTVRVSYLISHGDVCAATDFFEIVIPARGAQPYETIGEEPVPKAAAGGFTDIAAVPWAQEAIEALAARGIVDGVSAHAFEPDRLATRAEGLKLLLLAFDLKGEKHERPFADVTDSGAWYYEYVALGRGLALVGGRDDGRFEPDSPITREELAAMLLRAMNLAGKKLPDAAESTAYEDMDSVSPYAAKAVETLAASGVFRAAADNRFAPRSGASRAEAAYTLYQLLKLLGL